MVLILSEFHASRRLSACCTKRHTRLYIIRTLLGDLLSQRAMPVGRSTFWSPGSVVPSIRRRGISAPAEARGRSNTCGISSPSNDGGRRKGLRVMKGITDPGD